MASRKVFQTNKYLRDPQARAAMILKSTKTSSAVEGIRKPFTDGDLPAGKIDRSGIVFSGRLRGR